MSRIKTLIVDDEPLAQDILEVYVGKLPDMELVGKCRNALEAFQQVSKGEVDLLLLDINMPEITGMDFLKTLKNPPKVVFTTAYSEFALESYELNAVDYLLKPISFDRFMKAVAKVKDAMSVPNGMAVKQGETHAIENMIFVKTEGKLVRIDLAQLWFVEGLKDYVKLWTAQGKIIVHSTMKNFEDNLSQYRNFLRVHKSYIVNMEFISEIDGNTIRVKDQSITIGSTYRDDVFRLFDTYKLL